MKNREIKFKAWDKTFKDWSMAYGSAALRMQEQYSDRFIVMQYTGLKDKNGKEIYEGDILEISNEHLEVVEWVDETNWNAEKCPVNGFVNHESIYKKKPEIIGNIYENPELIIKKP